MHRFFKKFQEYFENAMSQTKILLLQLYNHKDLFCVLPRSYSFKTYV